jgi:hypothetical protein
MIYEYRIFVYVIMLSNFNNAWYTFEAYRKRFIRKSLFGY